VGFNWRYDSRLVAGAVPVAATAGGDVDLAGSGLTPDQEFQAGFSCNRVRATPTVGLPDTCPGAQFTSNLLKIPAPGTAGDDSNPPRVAPRHLFDIAIGHDNLFHGDKYQLSLQLTAVTLPTGRPCITFCRPSPERTTSHRVL